ncbi:hypothetical protein ACFQH2_14100 [Natronoarchaeum sp. GCM10025703]|uniref:hypothetical protein n=1 Tax=unclassified Natronoarchaeum TaxID=2620183 RepID=UPI00361CEB42
MNRERGLWATLVGLAAGDAATTITALALGLPEANPLFEALMGSLGIVAVPLSQVLYVGLASAVITAVERGRRTPVLLAGILPSALVVANNLAWITVTVTGWSA